MPAPDRTGDEEEDGGDVRVPTSSGGALSIRCCLKSPKTMFVSTYNNNQDYSFAVYKLLLFPSVISLPTHSARVPAPDRTGDEEEDGGDVRVPTGSGGAPFSTTLPLFFPNIGGLRRERLVGGKPAR